jgi:hypothetical protein
MINYNLQDTMTQKQYFELILGQIQPENIFIKIIQKDFEYPQVIFILHNSKISKGYYKVYCKTLKDEAECTFLMYQKGYKKATLELKTQNERFVTYSNKL